MPPLYWTYVQDSCHNSHIIINAKRDKIPVKVIHLTAEALRFTNKAVNRGDKRSRRIRDRDFAKFERSRRYRDRYRCQEKKSRCGRDRDLVLRDPPPPRTRARSLFAVRDSPPPLPALNLLNVSTPPPHILHMDIHHAGSNISQKFIHLLL